jgi:3-keto-5-aminohexanoate cleavage enzyme
MENKVIITVAPTGSFTTRKNTPYLPITPAEIIEESIRSVNAGASVVHLHARDPQTGAPTNNPELFREYMEGIRAHFPNLVLQITTGGGAVAGTAAGKPGLTPEERLKPVEVLVPESATLNCGSYNVGMEYGVFMSPSKTIENYARRYSELGVMPEFEVYDGGMLNNIDAIVAKQNIIPPPYRISFVLGMMGNLPASPKNLLFLKELLPPGTRWQTIGIGRHEFTLGAMGILLGSDVRVGFEDNIYLSRGVLAKSNAELVERMVRIVHDLGFEVATIDEARELLPLLKRQATAAS